MVICNDQPLLKVNFDDTHFLRLYVVISGGFTVMC